MSELPEHVRRNRGYWKDLAADYEQPGRRRWAEDEPSWGIWGVAESELRMLPADLAGRVDVLCANVPYVPSRAIATLPRDVRDHEPLLALDGGPDGLDVLRRVTATAGRWLAPGGFLLCEIGEDQGEAAAALLADAGLTQIAVLPDMAGGDRVVEGRRGPAGGVRGTPRGSPGRSGPKGVPR
jgi:hypothetical protein